MKFNWGHGILIFLTLFVAASVAFIVFSFRQKHDLVATDYYKLGAHYTDQMLINQRSAVYIDSVQINIGSEKIEFFFASSVAQEIESLQVYFYRPSNKNLDIKIPLLLKDSIAQFDLGKLEKGRYKVRLQWIANQEVFQVRKEIFIK